ncbi:hypothetical protein CVE22_23360, partial [Pseudomonas syringae pv. actinidiae]|nr:hypothetical protein [Pseudomonas syringae pv. actinidiae]
MLTTKQGQPLRSTDHCYLSFNYQLSIIAQTLLVEVQFVTLRITQRFCDVSDVCLRLRSPFRPYG